MNADIPKTPDHFVVPNPIAIERFVAEYAKKTEPTKKRIATQALYEARIHKPKVEMSESDIEDVRNETIANKLVNKYKNKGGIEVIFSNTSAEISNMYNEAKIKSKQITPDQNIAIVCEKNSFPVILEFRKPDSTNFDMDIFVEAQSYTDPITANEHLIQTIKKHSEAGFVITKADIGVPNKNGDEDINMFYKSTVDKLTNTINTSNHAKDMTVILTEYDTAQLDKKGGVVFTTEIDNGLHSTTTKINDKIISPSYEYTRMFV